MQDFISLRLNINPCNETITDLTAAFLADIGYDYFMPDGEGVTSYISKKDFDPVKIENMIKDFPIKTDFTIITEEIEGRDWNEEWEKNYFKPIVIGDKVVVHSSFHTDIPDAEYEIIIDPKMAFGTGHHSTTGNMMRLILDSDLSGKNVIDMGTGTGILAILCKMRGANEVTGIEIDPDAYENAKENAALNKSDIDFICGDAENLKDVFEADLFLANINRNIILNDFEKYVKSLKKGGKIFLSGFYVEDVDKILERAYELGLQKDKLIEENNWAALSLIRRD